MIAISERPIISCQLGRGPSPHEMPQPTAAFTQNALKMAAMKKVRFIDAHRDQNLL
jgi:hypothetical protein